MSDLNDVVRHVILRITVDQAGLSGELAAAREKLKALKQTEKESNKERVKSNETVTNAIKQQNTALDDNAEAHKAASRASSGTAADTGEIKKHTDAIKADTAETKKSILEEAKAEGIRKKNRQEELDSIANRSAAKKKAAEADALAAEKTALAAEKTRNEKLGGQTGRANKSAETNANIARKDVASVADTVAKKTRLDDTAAATKTRADDTAAANKKRADDNAAAAKIRADNLASARQIIAEVNAQAGRSRAATESAARTATSRARTEAVRNKETDAKKLRDNSYVDRETAVKEVAKSATIVAQQRAEGATSIADAAGSRAADSSDRTKANFADRRVKSQREINKLQAEASRFSSQQQVLDQRLTDLAERRARAAEKERTSRRGLIGTAGALLADVSTLGLRTVTAGGSGGAVRRGLQAKVPDVNSEAESFRRVTTLAGRAESAVAGFFSRFGRDGEKSLETMGKFRAKLGGIIDSLNRPRRGGSGDGLLSDLVGNFATLGSKLSSTLSGMRVRLVSFQSLILAAVAALGPLAAILGAVGAAALGLASNIVALSGSLLALPGILGAAVAGFGALALVMKPITSVFSAYSAAQKEATKSTQAATSAALDYKSAVLSQKQAELDYKRSQQDGPRLQQKLNDARKQAARDIQDYRNQLAKLKFDEEGASLGVESAELEYRKVLADPTATDLDRRIAEHNLQGSQFDQKDQATAGQRLKEDSKQAFDKGIDGADGVVEAQRAVEDQTYKIQAAYIAWQQSIIAVNKAAGENKAGGTAAAALQAEIDKLPPKTRKVVQALLDLQASYKSMRDRLSENIFGPVSKDTGKFRDVLKSLEAFLTPASKAVGVLLKSAVDLFTNPEWKKFFSEQGEESGKIVGKLGDALLLTADAFRSITEVARPFTRFVVDGIKGLAESFNGFATSDEGRKKISDFLKLTKKRIEELAPVISNFASGLAGFFAALNSKGPTGEEDFTTGINKGLLTASETFKSLGDAARDPNGGFQKWLRDVKPLLHDIVGFLSGAAKFFGDLFSDTDNLSEASKLLEQISTRWFPALAEFFDKLSQSGLISKLATGISSAFEGVNKFFDNGGLSALSAFATALEYAGKVIGGIATVIDYLGEHVSGLNGVFQAIGTTIAFVFGAALVAKISGISTLIKGAIALTKGAGNVFGSIYDREPGERGRIRGAIQDKTDAVKDTVLNRDSGTSRARRNARDQAKIDEANGKPDRRNDPRRTTTATPAKPSIDRSNTGGVLPTLYRIEKVLEQIRVCVCRMSSGTSKPGKDDDNKPNGGKNSPNPRRNITVPDAKPGSSTGYGDVGPSTVSDGVDPNSKDGQNQRLNQAQKAREDRLTRGSTPTGRNERAGGVYSPNSPARKPSRLSRIFNRFGDVLRNDEGSVALGRDADEAGTTRRKTTTRPPTTGRRTKTRRRGKGRGRPSLPTGGLDDYEEGFEDGLRAGSGGSGLDLPDTDRDNDRPRRGTTADDDAPRRTGGRGTEAERPTRRGRVKARLTRPGGVLGNLGRGGTGFAGKLGGGLLRGAAGGIGGLVAGAAATLGGDYLINKFVKNDDDAGSLQRGLGAVANGAGIGATIGSIVPGVGTVIGGAIGGLAGGAYSLYKDKNLRSFVGDKLGGAGKAIGGAVKGVGSAVGGFFSNPGKALGGLFGGSDGKLGAGGAIAAVTGPIGALLAKTDIGKSIIDSLDKAGSKIGGFFTKTIPDWFDKGVSAISTFFTKTLPSLPGRAFDAFFRAIGRIGAFFTKDIPRFAKGVFDGFQRVVGRIGTFFTHDIPRYQQKAFDAFFRTIGRVAAFFTKTLPRVAGEAFDSIKEFFTVTLPFAAGYAFGVVKDFFTKDIPRIAGEAWGFIVHNLWDPFVAFVKAIPGFFTETIPKWFSSVYHWYQEQVAVPFYKFITETIPGFFTETIPKWFETVPAWFKTHVIDPISSFFTETLPGFFTETLPNAISKLPSVIYDNLIQPVLDFFKGLAGHVGEFLKGGWDWAKGLFNRASNDVQEGYNGTEVKPKMSGGLIEGIYQGIEDKARVSVTPGEWVVRRSKVEQPQGKRFLSDYNEGRFDPAAFYSGLSAATAPPVMAMVPAGAQALTSAVPSVVNHTVNHAPVMGDVTINNPVRERSEHSLRRQVQIANIRHRR